MKRFHKSATGLAVALALALVALPDTARADSCWTHNGSLMRLQAQGQNRWLSYEAPRQALRPAGVRHGTLLFDGTTAGDWYSGTARVFSSACPGAPLEYPVAGPVLRNPLRIVLRGTRQLHQDCAPTGQTVQDELVFAYSHQC